MRKVFIILLLTLPAYAYDDNEINLNWFNNFNDENISYYILYALNQNNDINIAQKNILFYIQEKNKTFSRLFPNINTGSDYALIKLPKTAIPSTDIQTNSYALPFLVSWEIDYLQVRLNKTKIKKYDIKNAYLDLFALKIAVATDTAAAYINISNLLKQIELQNRIIENLKTIKVKMQKMYDYGLIKQIELNNIEKRLLAELNNLEKLYMEKEVFLSELYLLIGKSAYEVCENNINTLDKIEYNGIYPNSLGADVILSRPDVLVLENEIKKAKIAVTMAKKDFFPKINILGTVVFSTIVQNFGWDGVFAGLLAGASQNLFDGGYRIFNLKQSKIQYDEALEKYLKRTLEAIKEVNDSLYILKKDIQIYENYKKQYAFENENYIKIFKSYNAGEKSHLEYLNNEIELIKCKMALLNAKNRKFTDLLTLYKLSCGRI